MIRVKNPAKELFATLLNCGEIIATDNKEHRKKAYTTKIGNITIDTVKPSDTLVWETGIRKRGKWTIVEQYPNKAKAEIGHYKWVESIRTDPKMPLTDIFLAEVGNVE